MQVVDLIKFSSEILKTLSRYDIRTSDYEFVALYGDYLNMLKEGCKTTYIVAKLSEKYHISERTIYRVLQRFKTVVSE